MNKPTVETQKQHIIDLKSVIDQKKYEGLYQKGFEEACNMIGADPFEYRPRYGLRYIAVDYNEHPERIPPMIIDFGKDKQEVSSRVVERFLSQNHLEREVVIGTTEEFNAAHVILINGDMGGID